jgi:hypothetical protein
MRHEESNSDTDEGEEIYMSYGPHPNDFLLTECKYIPMVIHVTRPTANTE